MGILNKIRRRFEKSKDKLEEQNEPDDIGVIKHQEAFAGKVESVYRMTSKNLLSLEEQEVLLVILEKRFVAKDKHYIKLHGIVWEDVQKKLEDSPEKMWSLQQMEATGGEPDVLGYYYGTDEYAFVDCSPESPEGRRNCVYDREGEVELKKRKPSANYKSNAVSMAALMEVDILNETQYRWLQTIGKFDEYSWSWIKTPIDKRKAGVALCGRRDQGAVDLYEDFPYYHSESRAWRGVLRV